MNTPQRRPVASNTPSQLRILDAFNRGQIDRATAMRKLAALTGRPEGFVTS